MARPYATTVYVPCPESCPQGETCVVRRDWDMKIHVGVPLVEMTDRGDVQERAAGTCDRATARPSENRMDRIGDEFLEYLLACSRDVLSRDFVYPAEVSGTSKTEAPARELVALKRIGADPRDVERVRPLQLERRRHCRAVGPHAKPAVTPALEPRVDAAVWGQSHGLTFFEQRKAGQDRDEAEKDRRREREPLQNSELVFRVDSPMTHCSVATTIESQENAVVERGRENRERRVRQVMGHTQDRHGGFEAGKLPKEGSSRGKVWAPPATLHRGRYEKVHVVRQKANVSEAYHRGALGQVANRVLASQKPFLVGRIHDAVLGHDAGSGVVSVGNARKRVHRQDIHRTSSPVAVGQARWCAADGSPSRSKQLDGLNTLGCGGVGCQKTDIGVRDPVTRTVADDPPGLQKDGPFAELGDNGRIVADQKH